MINYNHLYYFHVTAAEGTVAKAAEKLGVGQPTVSEQIRQLERSLGTPLFERSGGKLKLTESGRGAYEHTSVMFRAGERLVQTLVRDRTPPVQLRVGVSSTVARSVATDFLMPVLAIDDCIPTIRMADSHELLRDLRAHDLDLILSDSDPGEKHRVGIQMVTIQKPTLVAITSATEGPDKHWEGVTLIHYRPGSVYRFPIDNYLDEHDLRPRITAETDDPMFMMAAVLRGFVAFVPWSVAREHVTSGKVRVIDRFSPENAAVNALYHDAENAMTARRAVELLVDYARKAEEG